jgi:stage III sporulation protein AD
MSIGWLLGVCVLTVVATVLLKGYHPVFGIAVAIIGGIVILLSVISAFREVKDTITDLFSYSGVDVGWLSLLLKALGIGYLCGFASDLCRDVGETALSGYVELAGKMMIVILSFPLLEQVAKTVLKLMDL